MIRLRPAAVATVVGIGNDLLISEIFGNTGTKPAQRISYRDWEGLKSTPVYRIFSPFFQISRVSHENRHDAKGMQAYNMKLPVGIFIIKYMNEP